MQHLSDNCSSVVLDALTMKCPRAGLYETAVAVLVQVDTMEEWIYFQAVIKHPHCVCYGHAVICTQSALLSHVNKKRFNVIIFFFFLLPAINRVDCIVSMSPFILPVNTPRSTDSMVLVQFYDSLWLDLGTSKIF